MKTRIIVLLFTLFVGVSSLNAQEKSSQLTFEEESLFYAGKVWGFVKYYHPEARTGKFNMDSLLVVLLDKSAETKTLKERNAVLNGWVSQFGKIKEFEKFIIKDSSQYKQLYDYSWLTNSTFDKKLSKALTEIKDAKRIEVNHYAAIQKGIGNIVFTNEKQDSIDLVITCNRLLPLMRYWNMVEYFFSYKYLIGKSWDEVLKSYIPLWKEVDKPYKLNNIGEALAAELNDGHSGLVTPYYFYQNFMKKYAIPVSISYINNQFIVTDYWVNKNREFVTDCGLQIGDIILSIDKINPDTIMSNHSKMLASSNINSRNNTYGSLLLPRIKSNTANVVCVRDGKEVVVEIKAYPRENVYPNIPDKSPVKIIDGNIGYISPKTISLNIIDSMLTVIKDTKGIIIDMRCYPSGNFFNFISRFLTDTVMSPQFSFPNLQHPGNQKLQNSMAFFDKSIKMRYDKPIVLLVDHSTISKTEYMVLFMQQNKNTLTIGSQTAGANGDVSKLPLYFKQFAKFSGYGVHNSDGTEMQRIGVRLDETVYPTIEDIKKGIDRPLQRAIEILKTK